MSRGDIETMNMRSVTLERVQKQIKLQLMSENYTPVTLIGKSGIGKTEGIASVAKELGIGFLELRLGQYQESDLVGMPYLKDDELKNKVTSHAVTGLLPPTNDPNQGILLLDEVTSSARSMRSAVYQLMDSSRKLGEYVLPKRWLIVACGNGPDDGGDFRGIEAAFLSRGYCWRVEPNFQVWEKWALAKGIHPSVIAFLKFDPSYLHHMDPDTTYEMIACPRNWVKLSTLLTTMEEQAHGVITDDDDLEFCACGSVGENCGPQFAAFYRYNKAVINVSDILDGKVAGSAMAGLTKEVMYLTAEHLISALANDVKANTVKAKSSSSLPVQADCYKRVCNAFNFLSSLDKVRGVNLDLPVMVLESITKACPNISEIIFYDNFGKDCPELERFCLEHDVMISAM